jgi:hypothetical protein
MTKVAAQVTEPKKFNESPFEFILYINNNIVCQRFFDIYDFNKDSLKSFELKEMIDNITGTNNGQIGTMGIIPNFLKQKSVNYLWDNYKPYLQQTDDFYKGPVKKGDVFKFEFKHNKKVVIASEFPNEFFTLSPKISIDIKEIIPTIMSEIRHFLSRKKYNKVLA